MAITARRKEVGGSEASGLAEAYPLGESGIAANKQVQLGKACMTHPVDGRDLSVRFLTDTSKIPDGIIEYFSPLLGDTNDDG